MKMDGRQAYYDDDRQQTVETNVPKKRKVGFPGSIWLASLSQLSSNRRAVFVYTVI